MNGQNQPVNDKYQFTGIRLDKIFNAYLENVRVKNAVWAGIAVYRFSESFEANRLLGTTINHCVFEKCGLEVGGVTRDHCYGGVYLTNWIKGMRVVNCQAHECYNGFILEDVTEANIANCFARKCENAGFAVVYCYHASLVANRAFACKYGIEFIGDVRFVKLVANTLIENTQYGLKLVGKEIAVIGNTAYKNGDAGAYLACDEGSVFVGNVMVNNGSDTGTYNANVVLAGNGVLVVGNNLKCDGSVANFDKVVYGIYELDGKTNKIYYNDVSGNPTPIRLSAGEAKHNIGFATENSGVATFSGDGSATQFTIPHGLVAEPSVVNVTPLSADAAGDFYVTKDADNIYVNYLTAPPSGTDNVVLAWRAEV
mgnify:CR=1 FL=1